MEQFQDLHSKLLRDDLNHSWSLPVSLSRRLVHFHLSIHDARPALLLNERYHSRQTKRVGAQDSALRKDMQSHHWDACLPSHPQIVLHH